VFSGAKEPDSLQMVQIDEYSLFLLCPNIQCCLLPRTISKNCDDIDADTDGVRTWCVSVISHLLTVPPWWGAQLGTDCHILSHNTGRKHVPRGEFVAAEDKFLRGMGPCGLLFCRSGTSSILLHLSL
jgi:hypothetical protein